MMKRLLAIALAACAGCATVNQTKDFHGVCVENGKNPFATVEIENTGWLLFKFIPLGSGDPEHPNEISCRLFRDTVTLQNNLDMLGREMERTGATHMTNLSSRKTDESVFVVLLTRRAYHTSAVLLKPEEEP